MPEHSLQQLQHWMETVIITRGDLQEKLHIAGLDIDELIASKKGLSAQRRLDIYASGYVLRLLECMKCEFPALQAFMSEPVFEVFAKAYIVSLPPKSWSLFSFGERFPQFLRDTQPTDLEEQALWALPAEIATLERIKAEVMNSAGTEQNASPAAHLSPGILDYLYEDSSFQAAPCLRLVQLKFPLIDFITQLEQGNTPAIPEKKTSYLAVTRKDFRLRMLHLEPWQYAFLEACSDPVSAHQGAVKAAETSGVEVKKLLAHLFVWLPLAIDSGCLTPVAQNFRSALV